MGKVPVRLKEVVYTISPFETTVLSGLFKDLPHKFHDKFKQVIRWSSVFSPKQVALTFSMISF
jgi:hypothetical protein